jgi:hypothetical protein
MVYGEGLMIVFEITKEEIERLDSLPLTNSMKKILRAEISKLKLKQSEVVVSLDINDPDAGLDAYIGCQVPEDHPWLPPGKSGWQFKAVREFPASKVEEEILTADRTDVKPRIKKLLGEGETYVLVIGRKDYNQDKLAEKEEELRRIFAIKGYPESKAKVYSAGQIADWANSLPSVVAFLNSSRANFKDIVEWRERTRVITEPREFVSDGKRENIVTSIRKNIFSGYKGKRATIIRLVGFSGVGKTRLIYEALNTDELKDLMLYTESPEKLPTSRFNEIAMNENITAIFVIDECPHDKYVQLAKEAEGIGGRMILITLDYDVDRPRDPLDLHFTLQPLENDATDKLVQLTVPGLPDMARKKIVDFSEGYPRIAMLLSENFSSHPDLLSPSTLSRIGISDLFDRIIAGRYGEPSIISKLKIVLTMIALFRRLGWDDEVAIQGKKLCEFFRIDWNEARQIVKEQVDRGLVIKRDRYRYVTPLPLAIYLASSWWEAMDESHWLELLKELPDWETKAAFLDRLKDLPYSEQAQKALKNILSEFNYGLLDNPNGSEIFLGLTKADHLSAMETLDRILGDLSREKLLEFKTGRRNVVWALEKIAWWQDTFHRAARLLLKLADAENETWSNNATGTFTQFFQTYLGGTAVPAWDRHSVLEEALDSGNQSLQKIALKGLDAAFKLQHAFRILSAEEQGTIILPPEWNPRTREDLERSVLSALHILDKALNLPDSEIRSETTKVFLHQVRILLAHGFKDEVMERLRLIRIQFPELEREVIRTVESVIYYDSKRLPMEVINAVRVFREELIGYEFKGLMKRYVRSALLEDQLEENREIVEKVVRKLVDESIKSPEKLKNELKWLVTNEAENGSMFGQILGESDKEYYWLDMILQALKESENPSVLFLGGYLSSVKSKNEDLWERTLYKCYNDQVLKKFILEIIWRSGPSDRAVKLIIEMLKSQEIEPQKIRLFTFGAWFSKVSEKSFVEFLWEYYKIENGKYAPVILGIIEQYVNTHLNIIGETKNILLAYLIRPEIFASEQDNMAVHYWDNLSNKLMNRFDDTIPDFLDLVLGILTKEYGLYVEPYFRTKLEYFLKKDVETTWKQIGKDLLAHDLRAWRLIHLLKGDYSDFRNEKNSLLGLIPETQLWEWIEENPDRAPYILARMIPLHEGEPLLHPLARKLLIKYPSDEDIASELSANWHTEGWSGSPSLHYEEKLKIAGEWTKDPEIPVGEWANKEAEYIKKQIENARKKEDESEF